MIFARVTIAVSLFILIWLVQLIIYPSFTHIQASSFPAWHGKYMNLISIFVMPLMLAELGILLYITTRQPNLNHISSVVVLAVIWLSTFFQAVPLHNTLVANGFEIQPIKKLIQVNWVRTIGWTLLLVLALWDYAISHKILSGS